MNRRSFIAKAGLGSLLANPVNWPFAVNAMGEQAVSKAKYIPESNLYCADIVIAGAGLGGCASAFAALRNGHSVIMTEETDWIGGQLSQQGVPPDEHDWIEDQGCTEFYRAFRQAVRAYYVDHYPLVKEEAKNPLLNPGNGVVSALCHEPLVAVKVLEQLFAPYISNRQLILLKEWKVKDAVVKRDMVSQLVAVSLRSGKEQVLEGKYFVDATELGDLLPITGTDYQKGTESKSQTGELHAAEKADPENQQAFTMCFAMDYVEGEDWTISKPDNYEFWQSFSPEMKPKWAGKLLELNYSNPKTLKPKALAFDPRGTEFDGLLNLWNYRKIIDKHNFDKGFFEGDISVVNWPQNDYFLGNLVDVKESEFKHHVEQSKQLSLSLLYWLQTEAPRADGGKGWRGLRLRNDIMGTEDGLAKYPYIRESRRIKAEFTILEEHVGRDQRAKKLGLPEEKVEAAGFDDSVGVGYYHIDLHPSTGGDNYIDFSSLRFEIPLGALLPKKMKNLLPANKNIGTTHITNGCYRLHPVEWSIGEAVGMLCSYSLSNETSPKTVWKEKEILRDFQGFLQSQGIANKWSPISK